MTPRRLLALVAVCVLAAPAAPAAAQDVPVVFVHGGFASSDTWREAASRLASTLQISPHLVDLPSTSVFEQQTAVLDAAKGGLPTTTIAVGHSNGGIVSRQWSRSRTLGGILTLGTAHTGLQLSARALDLVNFNYLVYNVAALAAGTASSSPDFAWLIAAGLQAYLSNVQWLSWNTASAVTSSVAVAGYVPLAPQVVPGSSFLTSLNAGSNLAREAGAVRRRVGLVYTAHDYWRAGMAVGLAPGSRETAWAILLVTPPALEYAAAWLDTRYGPTHLLARTFAMRLRSLAGMVRDMDPQWCYAVTGDRGCSVPHDGIVSVVNQHYPGGMNFAVNGPAHKEETRKSDGVIASVLTGVMGVVARGAAPPPPSGGGDGSDGLSAGQRLYPDQQVVSADGAVALRYQSDGNLVLYGSGGRVLWDTATWGHSAGRAEMQLDGNFVVYDASGVPVWASDTAASGAYLRVHGDGYVMVHDASGVGLWWSGSGEP
jgi:pimeloyl-ACP methyl ester carboxylesterase